MSTTRFLRGLDYLVKNYRLEERLIYEGYKSRLELKKQELMQEFSRRKVENMTRPEIIDDVKVHSDLQALYTAFVRQLQAETRQKRQALLLVCQTDMETFTQRCEDESLNKTPTTVAVATAEYMAEDDRDDHDYDPLIREAMNELVCVREMCETTTV